MEKPHQGEVWEASYICDPVAGGGVVPVYDGLGSEDVLIWRPEEMRWQRGQNQPYGTMSMFRATKPSEFRQEVKLAISLLSPDSGGRLVLWFFGRDWHRRDSFGLLYCEPGAKAEGWNDGFSYEEMVPKEYWRAYPKTFLEDLFEAQPGLLSLDQARGARERMLRQICQDMQSAQHALSGMSHSLETLKQKVDWLMELDKRKEGV